MCGISALVSTKALNLQSAIAGMTSLIRHRGPDDEGYVLFSHSEQPTVAGGKDTPQTAYTSHWAYCPKKEIESLPDRSFYAALGHRRLSILDLSPAGHQPMCTPDQTVWMTYNGEIYNYIEIRHELQALGCEFRTQSDTEVLLKAYEIWGIDCLKRLNGMFAFVIFDCKRNKVFAVRDRFGVKPLYYWISPQGIVAFASEIKQFTVLPGWEAKMHGQGVYDFLNWGILDHDHTTLFEGVYQLRGGEYLELPLGHDRFSRPRVHRWYNLKEASFKGSFLDAADQYRHLLTDAINIRLRADVDVGSCLSGGLDSSSIVCVANELLKKQKATDRQKTFSACSDVARFDERKHINHVVTGTGVDAYYTYPSLEKLFEYSSDITWHQDEPFASTSIYAQWLVFKLAKDSHVKVMLDGQGADEQLAGYHGFFGNHFYDLFCSLQWSLMLKEMKQTQTMHSTIQPWSLLLNKFMPNAIRQPIRKFLGKSAANPEWLNISLLQVKDRDPFSHHKNKSLIHQSHLQLLHSSVPMLLHVEDRNSMAHAVESRTPFLDYRLVEFTLGLPGEYKLSQGWTKRVLRESMKGILPEQIRTRMDKMGFMTAEEEWVKTTGSQLFLNAIDDVIESSQGILKPSTKAMAANIISGKVPFSFLMWRLISFGHWIKRFKVNSFF